jgi:CheY-like chemotaxis protein
MVIGKLFGKDKGEGGNSDLAMAYLEEAQRLRASMVLVDPKSRELSVHIQSIHEDRIALQAQGLLPVEKGDKFSLLLNMDGSRFRIKLRAIEMKNGTLHVDVPVEIELAERRKRPRARLNAKEGATATALTGLFEGTGVTGVPENISEQGVRIRVEKAMEIKGERKLHPALALMPVGTQLMLIKLSKLPKAPNLEIDGKVVGVAMDGNTLCLNIAFNGVHTALRNLVASRSSAPPTSVPPKSRRKAELEPRERPSHEPELERSRAPEAPKPPAPVAEAAPAAAPAAAPVPDTPAEAPAERNGDRANALSALKKRTRAILIAMEDHPDRDWLQAFLEEEGYQRIHLASTLTQVLEALDQPGLSLIIIDGGVAEIKGIELADFLKNRLGEGKPPIILAQETVQTVLVLAARRAGVDEILVKPYDHDETLAGKIETLLGL